MRALIVTVGGVLLLTTAARGLVSFDLAGATRVGERPEPNAVVWLETAAALRQSGNFPAYRSPLVDLALTCSVRIH